MTTATAKAEWLRNNLKDGEIYAGIILGQNGEPDHHLVLLPGEDNLNWKAAQTWAKKQGGELPTRREQSLLFANCKDQFKPAWYWSGQQHESYASYAWYQVFSYGSQGITHNDTTCRCRAVRRIAIE